MLVTIEISISAFAYCRTDRGGRLDAINIGLIVFSVYIRFKRFRNSQAKEELTV